MPDSSLDGLDLVGPITGAEEIYLVKNGNSRRTTIGKIATALAGLVNAETIETPFRGAMLRLNAIKSNVDFPYVVEWDAAEYDTDGFFTLSLPTQLVIPQGVTKVRLYAGLSLTASTDTHSAHISFRKNNAEFHGCPVSNVRQSTDGWSSNLHSLAGPPIAVEYGDVIELRVNVSGSTVVNDILASPYSYMAIEVVEYVAV